MIWTVIKKEERRTGREREAERIMTKTLRAWLGEVFEKWFLFYVFKWFEIFFFQNIGVTSEKVLYVGDTSKIHLDNFFEEFLKTFFSKNKRNKFRPTGGWPLDRSCDGTVATRWLPKLVMVRQPRGGPSLNLAPIGGCQNRCRGHAVVVWQIHQPHGGCQNRSSNNMMVAKIRATATRTDPQPCDSCQKNLVAARQFWWQVVAVVKLFEWARGGR